MTRDPDEFAARARTAVAWGRTALGLAGLGVLFLRLGIRAHSALEIAGGAVLWLCCAGFATAGRAAYRHDSGRPPTALLLAGVLGVLVAGGLGAAGAVR
ncbi:MAG TPA: hypothetical protein VMB79_15110 [Jatrophihabitans sp.]|nr:hypothetical protein [Jatrophihabitans sp.]